MNKSKSEILGILDAEYERARQTLEAQFDEDLFGTGKRLPTSVWMHMHKTQPYDASWGDPSILDTKHFGQDQGCAELRGFIEKYLERKVLDTDFKWWLSAHSD